MYIYCREVEINVIHGDENILTKVFKNGKSDNPNDRDTKGHIKKGLTKMPGWEKAEVGDVKDLLTLQVPAWGIKQLEDMISKDILWKKWI